MVRASVRVAASAVLLLGFAVLLGQCAPGGEGDGTHARTSEGAKAFLAYCAACHGETGAGDGPESKRLLEMGVEVAHLNDPAKIEVLGPDGVREVVLYGGGHTGRSEFMPEWGRRLRMTVVDSIVAHVMTLPQHGEGEVPEAVRLFLQDPRGVGQGARRLYVFLCSGCHGPQGRGDGYNADTLRLLHNILPRDLTDENHFRKLSDRDIYDVIAVGGGHVGKSAFMPSWSNQLTPQQIESLVQYIRVLSNTAES